MPILKLCIKKLRHDYSDYAKEISTRLKTCEKEWQKTILKNIMQMLIMWNPYAEYYNAGWIVVSFWVHRYQLCLLLWIFLSRIAECVFNFKNKITLQFQSFYSLICQAIFKLSIFFNSSIVSWKWYFKGRSLSSFNLKTFWGSWLILHSSGYYQNKIQA
jgi:hypothetical protein